jgi:hypothetical protein
VSEAAPDVRPVRVTLTAAQLATPEGAALLSLCQCVTADGEVSNAEVEEIRAWVQQNESSGLVGTAFLGKTLTRLLADGSVDDYERHELQKALERVLPKKYRDAAIEARRAREFQRFKDAPQHAMDAPLVGPEASDGDVFDFMVAGIAYEGRAATIEEHVRPEECAHLWRDKENKFSKNAVAVRTGNGLMIGFVPEDQAEQMAPFLDRGYAWRAYFKKILNGHRGSIPVVVATFSLPGDGAVDSFGPCCESGIALLRAAKPKTVEEAVAVTNTFAARIAKEAQFAQPEKPTLNDLERMTSLALDFRPTVRDFLARSEAARPLGGAYEQMVAATEGMLGSTRQALEAIKVYVRTKRSSAGRSTPPDDRRDGE